MQEITCLYCLPAENPGSLSPISQLPPQDPGQTQLSKFRATGTKPKDNFSRGAGKAKERQKDTRSHLPASHTISNNKVPAHLMKAAVQALDSLRWEGALPDPQEEEKRLERYRAKRRQRYITHREALLKEAQYAMRKTEMKTKWTKWTPSGSTGGSQINSDLLTSCMFSSAFFAMQ